MIQIDFYSSNHSMIQDLFVVVCFFFFFLYVLFLKMAAEVAGDDDDAWLYGDNTAEDQRKEEINAIFDRATEDVVVPGEENVITTNGDIQVKIHL